MMKINIIEEEKEEEEEKELYFEMMSHFTIHQFCEFEGKKRR